MLFCHDLIFEWFFLGFGWLRYISGCHLFVLGFPFRSTVPFARTNYPCITQRKTFLRLSTLSLLIFVYFFSNSQISISLSLFHTNSIRVERAQCSLCGVLVISETCLYDHGWKGLTLGAIGGWTPTNFFDSVEEHSR